MIASIHAIATITFKADQIVSGIALNLFAVGITKFFCQIIFLSSSNSERIKGIEEIQIPFISGIPVIGNTFIFICLLILFASQYIISYTRTGLRLRAVGENPEAADTLGVNVNRIRYFGVLVSGLFAGLGGSWLALDQHSFTDNMSAGRGFIALAALIIGKWKPYNTAIACFLFGITESFSILMQGTGIPTQFIQMLPYIITIIVLAGLIGKSTPPAADGVPFNKNNDLKGYY
jgi:simple sugar transport system permease protein